MRISIMERLQLDFHKPGLTCSAESSDLTKIFNPQCRIVNLIEFVKETCGCEPEVCIDLIDESGNLMHLSEVENSSEFASNYLKERQCYILIKVIKGDGCEPHRYESLLQNLGRCHPELADRLQKLSKLQVKDRKSSMNRKGRHSKEPSILPSSTKPKNGTSSKKSSTMLNKAA
nr:PREDICTED: uncharacterized protein C22orf15 homolog [Latimeria chalumnae]|eukprot:XP_014340522.1 PREDICTED: uncharacterized protein C22orf15 homolog [Latimeria chalumnae]